MATRKASSPKGKKQAKQVDRGPDIQRAAERAGIRTPEQRAETPELQSAMDALFEVQTRRHGAARAPGIAPSPLTAEQRAEVLGCSAEDLERSPVDWKDHAHSLALEMRDLAGELDRAQDSFLSYLAEGSPDSDGIEAMVKLWSVRTCLRNHADTVLSLRGES